MQRLQSSADHISVVFAVVSLVDACMCGDLMGVTVVCLAQTHNMMDERRS